MAIINGTSSDDYMVGAFGGTDDPDFLYGFAGNDILYGGGGGDTLDGGDGFDIASYEGSTTGLTIDLATPSNSTGDAAGDTYISIELIDGSDFDDLIVGDSNSNSFFGGAGNDVIYGGGGDDFLYTDAGNDTLYGETGNDRFFSGFRTGSNIVDGGTGTDTIDYTFNQVQSGVTLNLATGTSTWLFNWVTYTDTLSSIENVTGSDFDDDITGDDGANVLEGGDGNDTLNGGKGDDRLDGGEGVDTADYSDAESAVVVDLSEGKATVAVAELATALEFDGSGDYLSKDFSGAGDDATKGTYSMWVKRDGLGSIQYLVAGETSNDTVELRFEANNKLNLTINKGGSNLLSATTTDTFTDTTDWVHIVLAIDTTDLTPAERWKLFVDGDRVTSFTFNKDLVQDTELEFFQDEIHYIGRDSNGRNFDGSLANIVGIDGQALGPLNFRNADGNAVNFNGNVGTNGFSINGANSANLGEDASGKGNDFTAFDDVAQLNSGLPYALNFDGTNDYLSKDFSGAGDDATKGTYSMWVKRDGLGSIQYLVAGETSNDTVELRFEANNKLNLTINDLHWQ